MLLVKDIRSLRASTKARWAGSQYRNAYFDAFKWAVVDHAHTEWETIAACFVEYDAAKRYTHHMQTPSTEALAAAKAAYGRYGDAHRWITCQGEPIPPWDQLPHAEQLAWLCAIQPLLSATPTTP